MTVLVIEDDPYLRSTWASMLSTEDYRVFSAADGSKGLQLLKQHAPDAVILDLGLPVLSGEEVLDRKICDPEIAEIPTIVVSARQDVSHSRFRHAVAVVRKPVASARILDLVAAVARK